MPNQMNSLMNRFLPILVLVLSPMAVAEEMTQYEVCERLSYIVRDLMQDRQNNVPLSKAIKIAAVKLHEVHEDAGAAISMDEAMDTAIDLANGIYEHRIMVGSSAEEAIVAAENWAFSDCLEKAEDD